MRHHRFMLSLVAVLGSACGSDEAGEPLLSATITGEYDGHPFTPAFGFATIRNGTGFIAVGDGPIHCGSENAPDPPSGTNASFGVPLEVGTRGSVAVQLYRNIGSFEGVGANTGSVTLTAVSDGSIAGTVAFDYTDTMTRHFALNGAFEVLRCPP